MIEGRLLKNLSPEGKKDAEKTIKTIQNHFGDGYLNCNKTHRLPKLWRRSDRLATVELYLFGVCLQRLEVDNAEWLKVTISSIKRQSEKSTHGFFTEIIYFGMFGLTHSQIIPAPKSTSGYDFSVQLRNNSKQFISIKNIDVSDAQKKFIQNSIKLRRIWIERLKKKNVSLGLRVTSSANISEEDFKYLFKFGKRPAITG